MLRLLLMVVVAGLASTSAFVIHVLTVEWLPSWIGQQMQGLSITPSWDVRYVAGLTAIEYGLAAMAIYLLGRDKFLSVGVFKSSLILAALLAAINGALIRQPLMDFVVGNPLHVVLVQNGFKWMVWLMMAIIVVFGAEYIIKPREKTV